MTMQDTATMEEDVAEKRPEISRRTLSKSRVRVLGHSRWHLHFSPTSQARPLQPFTKARMSVGCHKMEANDYKSYNSKGVEQDVLTILKGYGMNAIRLRTFVHPSNNIGSGHG